MKRIVLSLALAALLVPLMGAFEPAEASARWFAGVNFSVGGFGFSLGYSDFDRHRYGASYGPNYYYRTSRQLSYRGYSCGSACYIRDNYYYHHRDCPLVLQHFRHNRYDPYSAWAGLPYGGGYYYSRSYYGPYRPGYYNYRSRGYDHRRYETHRYDKRRYDHRRYESRYDRHDYRRDHDGDSDSDRYRGRNDRGRHGNDSGRYDDRHERRDGHRDDRGRGAARSRSRHRDD